MYTLDNYGIHLVNDIKTQERDCEYSPMICKTYSGVSCFLYPPAVVFLITRTPQNIVSRLYTIARLSNYFAICNNMTVYTVELYVQLHQPNAITFRSYACVPVLKSFYFLSLFFSLFFGSLRVRLRVSSRSKGFSRNKLLHFMKTHF